MSHTIPESRPQTHPEQIERPQRDAATSGQPAFLSAAGVLAHIPDTAPRTFGPIPCPICSGWRQELDGSWTVRTPILDYVREVLDILVTGESWVAPGFELADIKNALRVLSREIEAAQR